MINFSQWLESTEKGGYLSWNGQFWYESTRLMGDRPIFRIYWNEKKVDVEMAGPKHPKMKYTSLASYSLAPMPVALMISKDTIATITSTMISSISVSPLRNII